MIRTIAMIAVAAAPLAADTPGQGYRESLLSVVLQDELVDSPRIIVAPNGNLLVCCRRLKPEPATTLVYESTDRGKTWEMIHACQQNWYGPSLFVIDGELYMFLRGTTTDQWWDLVLFKSSDNGRGWERSTLLKADARTKRFTTGNPPILVTGERIIVSATDWGGGGKNFPRFFRLFAGGLSAAE